MRFRRTLRHEDEAPPVFRGDARRRCGPLLGRVQQPDPQLLQEAQEVRGVKVDDRAQGGHQGAAVLQGRGGRRAGTIDIQLLLCN